MGIENHPSNHNPEAKKVRDYFPTPGDWIALQGGRPRVFRNPNNPKGRWIVLHVYDEHDDHAHRFTSGLVVDTLAERTGETSRFHVSWVDKGEDGEDDMNIDKDIFVPSFMVRANHGEVCNTRSSQAGSNDGYERIVSQSAYTAKLTELEANGMEELRFSFSPDGNGFTMRALPGIRPARPLLIEHNPSTENPLPQSA